MWVFSEDRRGRALLSLVWFEEYNCYIIWQMRFKFDASKSREVKRKHGLSLHEAREVFDQVYVIDQKNDSPEQYRAIGWCDGRLCSVIYEVRYDTEGEYYRLITAWKATENEEQSYARSI